MPQLKMKVITQKTVSMRNWKRVFDQYSKYNMKILLEDFNAKVRTKYVKKEIVTRS